MSNPNPKNAYDRWNVRIPEPISVRATEALTSSRTGNLPYGAKSQLVAELLAAWLRGEITFPQFVVETPENSDE